MTLLFLLASALLVASVFIKGDIDQGGALAPDYTWTASGVIPASGASALTLQDPAGSEYSVPNNSKIQIVAVTQNFDPTAGVSSSVMFTADFKNIAGVLTKVAVAVIGNSNNQDSTSPPHTFAASIGAGGGSVNFVISGTHVRFQAQSSGFDTNAINMTIRVSIWEQS
jgi:hypothetical protein